MEGVFSYNILFLAVVSPSLHPLYHMTSFLSVIDLGWKSETFSSVLFLDGWGLCFLFWISILVFFSPDVVPVGSAAPGYRKWSCPCARLGICLWWRHPATTDPGEAGEGQYQNAGQVSASPKMKTLIPESSSTPRLCTKLCSETAASQDSSIVPDSYLPELQTSSTNGSPLYSCPSCYQGKAFLHSLLPL